ncbi:MAG: carboxymuconolactone decarboxylase family protein, partial [Bacteroidales bacterium]|nr:carboxymuconolactone decarboxylase family protein [Bacteroidales bacterium]
PPLAPAAFSDEQKDLVGDWTDMNFCRVIVRHPAMYRVFLPYIKQVIADTSLPPRDREILVLRALAVAGDSYETHHHVEIARGAGMTAADIEAARGDGNGLSDFDKLLMRAADELMATQNLSDMTWSGLSARYSEQQMMEVVFLVGCYAVMGMLTNTFGIPLEETDGADNQFNQMRTYT